MKKLFLLIPLVVLCGCGTTNAPMTHAAFQAAVTLGEQVGIQTHPEITPYLQAAAPVVCSVAHGSNANPAQVVAALDGVVTNATARIVINGSIALLNVVTASVGTNQPEVAAYVNDLCIGMQNGLPTQSMKAVLLPPHLR